MELKTIPTNQIVPNPEQPRDTFEQEKLKELAESILSNGLINPITVRKKGKQYEIVAGERRWKAHQIAKIKNVPAIVKEYNSEAQVAIESLIENIHRADLHPIEKAKFMKKIMDMKKIKTYVELGKIIGVSAPAVKKQLLLIEDKEIESMVKSNALSSSAAQTIMTLSDRESAKKLANKISKTEMGRTELRKATSIMSKAPTEVKDALLDDKITTDQAERIAKLKTESQRKEAIKQHEDISHVQKNVEKSVKQQASAKDTKKIAKQLVQSNNWIASFGGAVNDTKKEIEKTIKILLISTKFIPMMDEKQREKFDMKLDRFVEILDKGKQLSEQIQEKL